MAMNDLTPRMGGGLVDITYKKDAVSTAATKVLEAKIPTAEDLRDMFDMLNKEPLQPQKMIMSQDIFNQLRSWGRPIRKAAEYILRVKYGR